MEWKNNEHMIREMKRKERDARENSSLKKVI